MLPEDLKYQFLSVTVSCYDILNPICKMALACEPVEPYDFKLEAEEVFTMISDLVSDFNERQKTATEKLCDSDLARCLKAAEDFYTYTTSLDRSHSSESTQKTKWIRKLLTARVEFAIVRVELTDYSEREDRVPHLAEWEESRASKAEGRGRGEHGERVLEQ
ncbi:hypothetical protein EJ06DRAFT_531288 [Trichodelitschia bisporula]|uniref:Uncharacterized protein n=1 Tax=Trichodelitschia bisporula TaxID=703511 RepID=A0A6G1HSI1_9PEZI|nr:hypothetical protein EJ06DRAFT_531288 [Trichodelitschia bisporula]